MDLNALTPEQLYQLPAMAPPPGIESNFDNPESIAYQAIATLSIFLSVMVIAVGGRMYSRLCIVKRTGLDDWTAVLAALFTAGLAGTALYQLNQNWFGPHTWDIRLVEFISPTYNRLIFVLTILLPVASFLVKISILLFLGRIFPRRASPKTGAAIYIGLALNVLSYSALIITTGVLCGPRAQDLGQLPAQCEPEVRQDLGIATACLNAALDIYVLVVAIPAVLSLQLAPRKKVGIIAVMGMGVIAIVFSIVTLYYRADGSYRASAAANDPARTQMAPLIFTVLEPIFGVITACLPALPALWIELSKVAGSSLRSLLSRSRGASSFSLSRTNREYKKSAYELRDQSKGESTLMSKSLDDRDATFTHDTEGQYVAPHEFPTQNDRYL
ncbi:Uu.00g118280.m01.CDS01 [Anthostomella pinea]|uniref:Uu.00g118280.m01.CDS01 n=1 Tax=Anthostomella pinea TaxID=933095 RepID=A0AAI8VHF1_9PEZI|nr:Uu.00g118280.m01.CDS01 [Anthostomella pinea]